jgi:hypothetical protein
MSTLTWADVMANPLEADAEEVWIVALDGERRVVRA